MSLKILSVELVSSGSASTPPVGLRDDIGRFAFIGRSNVGKSSLINALVRQTIARTSAAAGKTRLATVFRVIAEGGGGQGQWTSYFVDLPGYGYARGGNESAKELAAVVNTYFKSNVGRAGAIFLLVDARHPGLASDIEARQWIDATLGAPRVIATKIDKLSRSERTRNLREFERVFAGAVLPVSSSTGEGLADLWTVIRNSTLSGE